MNKGSSVAKRTILKSPLVKCLLMASFIEWNPIQRTQIVLNNQSISGGVGGGVGGGGGGCAGAGRRPFRVIFGY